MTLDIRDDTRARQQADGAASASQHPADKAADAAGACDKNRSGGNQFAGPSLLCVRVSFR